MKPSRVKKSKSQRYDNRYSFKQERLDTHEVEKDESVKMEDIE